MDYVIAIPTYDRLNTFIKKTYNKIIKPNKLEDRVVLFIQNDRDEIEYREAFPEIKIVRSPPSYHHTLNFISKYFQEGTLIVKMDDDINSCVKAPENYVENKGKLEKDLDVNQIFINCFTVMKLRNCNLGGFYPSSSWFRGDQKTTDLRFIVGSCYCFINRKIYLPEPNTKSDFEFTIKNYQQDNGVVRFNRIAFRSAYNNSGGIERTLEIENRDNNRLFEKYPNYITRRIKHKNNSTSLVLKRIPIPSADTLCL